MKNSILFLLVSVFLIHTSSYSQSSTVQSIINQTNIDSLVFFVEELSGEIETTISGSPYTILSRHKNQPGNDKAADYIQQKLESYGLTVYNQSFSSTGRNVYGVQIGTDYPNQKYIICAHYDDMPSSGIAPGADDNGSGTAAVIETARILSQYVSEYTIIYALWDEEEQGLVGSDYYAQVAQTAGDSILGAINMDMIAWDSDNNDIADVHTRSVGTSIYLKDKMVEVNTLYNLGLNLDIKNPGSTYSDHASFWFHGFGAILLIEDGSDFNPYWHDPNDRVTNFNLPYYLKMSKVSLGSLATLVNVTGVVPVELVSFTGSITQAGVRLEWNTATELNNLGFEIERSIEGSDFITVGFVEGHGSTTETNYYSYTDNSYFSANTILRYRLKQVDFDGIFSYSNVITVEFDMPLEYALSQNYPNPFNPSTNIAYAIPYDGFVDLKVYNLMGETIAVLVNEQQPAGSYEITFNASDLPSGVYIYSLMAGEIAVTKKMMLTK
jgi:hypothetical protein